jgi:hypothetical protein
MTIAGIHSSSWWSKMTPIVGMAQKAASTCKNIASSMMGRALTYSVKENIAEYIGCYSGSIAGSAIVSKVAGSALKQLGRIAGYGIAAAAGAAVAGTVYKTGPNNPSWSRTIGAALLGIAMAIAVMYYSNPSEILGQAGEAFGTEAGSAAGSLAGAILGGFSAIYLHGSSETLWDENDPLSSYAIKVIQCLIAFTFLDRWRSPSNGLLRSIFDQALGSLIYNGMDIGSFLKRIQEGKVLDEVLPSALSDLIPEQVSRDSLKDLLSKAASQLVISKAKLSTLISEQSQSDLIKELQIPLMEEIQNIIFDSSLIPLEAELLHDQLKALIYPSAEFVLAQEPLTRSVKIGTDALLNFSIQATNRYIHLIQHDRSIHQAQQQFDTAYSAWAKASDPAVKKQLFQTLQQKKEELKAAIGASIYRDAMGLFYGLEAVSLVYQHHAVLKQQVSMAVPGTNEVKAKIIKELFTQAKGLLMPNNSHLPPPIEKSAEKILAIIQRTEQEIIGVSITPDSQKAYIGELLDVHLPLVARLVLIHSMQLAVQPGDDQIRQFYLNISTLIFGYYTSLLGTPVIGTVKDVLNNQIVQANLKK